jgi:hypothetical protein
MAKDSIKNYIYSMGKGIHESIDATNKSKVFAGLMIITLNIASRFVTIKLSKSLESYLKYTFSKQILVFAIAWMGTRDIYTAFVIMLALTLSIDYLFNEDSQFCILPETFTNYHRDLIDNDDDEVEKAKKVVENAETKEKKKEEMKVKEAITRNELVTLV